MLTLKDFDYNLPENLIAQYPLKQRDTCRLMHLNCKTNEINHKHFYDILDYLNKDDVLVLNNTKVFSARVFAKRKTGAKVEVFILRPYDNNNHFEVLLKNAKRVKINEILEVSSDFKIELIEKKETKKEEVPSYIVRLIYENNNIYDVLDKYGSIPLPPYISRDITNEDKKDYQTVFASKIGSVASPTAGLHFTNELLEKIKAKGVKIAYITLNVGLGTFMPVKTENILEHTMHYESYSIPKETEEILSKPRGAVVAVGTTVLRCLEDTKQKYNKIISHSDSTNIFIYPPYRITSIDKLITNFHLPKSTLIMLVSAFAGKDFIFKAYKEAIENKYRFFSYGDCMMIE